MKIGIMQPYFFPYLGYFQLIDAVDTFCIYEHVSFRKRSWITRNRILNKGTNEPVFINLPVRGKSSYKMINEIDINNQEDWRKTILNLIYFNYKKAPFFDFAYSKIESLLESKEEGIHGYNSQIIRSISQWLDIKTEIISKSTYEVEKELSSNNMDHDLDAKSKRIIKLCEQHNANHYINPIGGTELYHKDTFSRHNIKLNFISSNPIKYTQWGKEYIPYLSIVDMMMHVSKSDMQKMLKSYSLN